MHDRKIFAKNLQWLRQQKGKSQEQVAGDLGIQIKRYQAWEAAIAYPQLNMMIRLCDYIGYKNIYDLVTKDMKATKNKKQF